MSTCEASWLDDGCRSVYFLFECSLRQLTQCCSSGDDCWDVMNWFRCTTLIARAGAEAGLGALELFVMLHWSWSPRPEPNLQFTWEILLNSETGPCIQSHCYCNNVVMLTLCWAPEHR